MDYRQRNPGFFITLWALLVSTLLLSISELRAQPMWNAEGIANTAAATVNLTDSNGKVLGTVPVPFAKMLVEIKTKIQAVAGIQSELWIQAGSSPNAWAAPFDGRFVIAFNLPMLIAFGNDKDALAAVMGHETAHLVRRHSPARKNNGATVDIFGAFFSGLFEGVIQNKYQVSGVGNAIAEIGVELAKTSFTRDQEREADQFGLMWMNGAGYEPQGAIRLWKKMEGIAPGTELTFLSSHPSHSERIENLTQQISSLPSRPNITPRIELNVQLVSCDIEATSKDIRGDERATFISKCITTNPVNRQTQFQPELIRLAANKGSAQAQVQLGLMHIRGISGLQKDEIEAVRLYRLAADQGYAPGQSLLAGMYRVGRGGLPRDAVEAFRLYRLAVAQGYPNAQVQLGLSYFSGIDGLQKDEAEAVRLYRLAASQGDAQGQAFLAGMYANGRGGLQQDDVEAVRLLRLSVAQENPKAQHDLGRMYENGRGGLTANLGTAVYWYKLAAEQGYRLSTESLKRLGTQ